MTASTEFLIVGSGIAGASLAYALTKLGAADTLVVDGEATGCYHASQRSAAILMEGYGNAVVRSLTEQSVPFYAAPPEGFAEAPLLHRRGHLTVANEDGAAALAQSAASTGVQLVDPPQACAMVPALRPGRVAAATYDPDAADIDTDLFYQSCVQAARRHGADFRYNAKFEGAALVGDRWRARVGGQVIEAAYIVCAAGAWADEVAQSCGIDVIGMQPLRRTALLISPPAEWQMRDWPFVMTADETLYFKPDAGKVLLSPADETLSVPCDAQSEELDVAIAVHRLEQLVEITVRRIDHSWAGLRTFAPDRSPVVGFDGGNGRFFWFAGQGGYGFQIAPALAEIGAALLAGSQALALTPDDVARLSPGRFRQSAYAANPAH